MKFVILMSEGSEAWAKLSPNDRAAVMERHAEFRRALEAAGKFVLSKQLAPAREARTVRRSGDGRISVTDGPFTESKEILGGYAIFEFATREAAIESAKSFMELHRLYGEGWEGVCEMRELATHCTDA